MSHVLGPSCLAIIFLYIREIFSKHPKHATGRGNSTRHALLPGVAWGYGIGSEGLLSVED